MTMDMFLHLNGIKGETKDSKEKDGIDILSWSWGISNSGTFHTGSGGGSGKASFRDISLVKYIDKSTAALMIAAATGKHIPDGKIIVRKAGDSPQNYLIITMKKILVTAIDTGGTGSQNRLTENISLNFAEVKVEYFVQVKGTVASGGEFSYDIAANNKT